MAPGAVTVPPWPALAEEGGGDGQARRGVRVNGLNQAPCWETVLVGAERVDAYVDEALTKPADWDPTRRRTCHVPPVMERVGLPLAVHTEGRPGKGAAFDNVPATWLMIDSTSGWAPSDPWQSQPGPVTIVRRDGGRLEQEDFSVVHDFMSNVMDEFSDDPERAQAFMTCAVFQAFCRKYPEQRRPPNLLYDRVRIHGLSSETGQRLNGLEGYRGRPNAARGRCAVYVDDGEAYQLKEANLELLESAYPPAPEADPVRTSSRFPVFSCPPGFSRTGSVRSADGRCRTSRRRRTTGMQSAGRRICCRTATGRQNRTGRWPRRPVRRRYSSTRPTSSGSRPRTTKTGSSRRSASNSRNKPRPPRRPATMLPLRPSCTPSVATSRRWSSRRQRSLSDPFGHKQCNSGECKGR